MLREKRVVKQPEQYVIPSICYPRKRKKYKKRPTERTEYSYIPHPLKFVYDQNFYPVYAEFALTEREGTLVGETRLLNQYMNCKGIDISELKSSRLINMAFERKVNFELPPWQFMVEKLQDSQNSEHREWAQLIEKFCLGYENLMRARSSNMLNIRGYEEDKLTALAEKTEKVLLEKFEKYPCLYFKHNLLDNAVKFENLIMNEAYIQQLGYSVDSLTNTVLTEGVPQLMPNGVNNWDKSFFQAMFNPVDSFKETAETTVYIPTKSGFIRKMKCKAIFLPKMGEKTFYMTTLIVLTGEDEEPTKDLESSTLVCNKRFLEQMIRNEKQSQSFLDKYYNGEKGAGFYTNLAKICQVKEMEGFEVQEFELHKREL